MTTKREIYYLKVNKVWDNQCYSLSREQIQREYGEEKVNKDYKPNKQFPVKEGK